MDKWQEPEGDVAEQAVPARDAAADDDVPESDPDTDEAAPKVPDEVPAEAAEADVYEQAQPVPDPEEYRQE